MLALSFATGVVDAVGFVAFEHTFAANMTGNLVMVALGLVGAVDASLLGPISAILAFVAGAALGGVLMRPRHTGAGRERCYRGFYLTAVALALVAGGQLMGGSAAEWQRIVSVAVLGFAMGAQAALASGIGVRDVNTLVITLPLVALGARIAGAGSAGQVRRVAAVLLLGLGAVVGGLLAFWTPAAGLALAAAIAATVAAVGAAPRN